MENITRAMNITNDTRLYSPITLNREWSTLGRLVTIVFAACFGATVNGYFVASFFVQYELKSIGNVFHACAGFADMFITAGVLPIAATVLLSGVWDTIPVCHVLQTLTAASTYCYSIYFALVAAETYARVYHKRLAFVSTRVSIRMGLFVCIIMCVSVTLGIMGTYMKLDYDYCQRQHQGNFYFRVGTSVVVHGTCCIVTFYSLIASSIQIREHNRVRIRYQRPRHYEVDISLHKLNSIAYVVYVLCWLPYLVVVYYYPDVPDEQYYHMALIGVCRSLFTSIFYGSLHSAFGKAYSNIFYYCCCKTSMKNYSPRRRMTEFSSTAARPIVSEVKTHIMQTAVSSSSPQRPSTSTAHESTEL